MKRRTEITIETERIVATTGNGADSTRWCEDCNAQSYVSLDEASKLLRLDSTSILRLIGAECRHVDNKATRNIFVCLNSLLVEVMSKPSLTVGLLPGPGIAGGGR
jgi:hypothetical protein